LIVGEESFGKGLVQQVWALSDGAAGLTLTTAKYYTPSGRSIQREYNGVSFYDYYYARRYAPAESSSPSQAPDKSSPAPEASPQGNTVFTPTGRKLQGGGGITPDIPMKLPDEDVRWRDACFEFARRLVGGAMPGLEPYKVAKTEYGHRLRGHEYALTEAVVTAFRAFLREHPEFYLSEAQVASHLDYIRRRIRAEVITAAYGIEVADQFLLESDLQALAAVEAIPKAKNLTDTARLFAPAPERH
jgi:carboxyl-terminal processing protease